MIRAAQIERMMVAVAAVAAIILLLSHPIVALAEATFTLINVDPAGVGYNDPTPVSPVDGNPGTTLGEQRLNAVRYAAEIWGALLDSGVDIRVVVSTISGCAFGGYTSVGSVARDFVGAPFPNTWYPIALANRFAGVDLCPEDGSCTSADDIVILLARDCGLDLRLNPGSTRSWASVMLHELAHGLGFTTQMDIFTGAKLMGFDDIYMRHLEDHATGLLYPNMTDAERAAGNMNPPHLHWVGPNVVAASDILTNGVHPSGHVEMMAFTGGTIFGTSVYHFSGTLVPQQLMGSSFLTMHDVGLARELLGDIGWFAEGPPDGWQCYPVKDLKDPPFAPRSLSQSDAFGTQTATLRKPVMLCNSANVGSDDPPTPTRHLVCYQIKDVDDASVSTVSIEDRFGALSLKVKKPKLLCVPATVSPLP